MKHLSKHLLVFFLLVFLTSFTNNFAQIKHISYVDYLKNQGFQLNENLAPFYHGVASGDPMSDRVIIWTRVTPSQNEASNADWKLAFPVNWKIATDTAFSQIVKSGDIATDELKDFTVKVDVTGLLPNTTYYYQFEAFGKKSMIGITKTLMDDDSQEPVKLIFVEGNNYSAGYFNTYKRINELKNVDAVVMLSGYINEGETAETLIDRREIPAAEPSSLKDFRFRYAQYHLDNNLMETHAKVPFIAIWKDQSLKGSKEQAANWDNKQKAAEQAFLEWMPVRVKNGELHRSFSFGKMLDLILMDTNPTEQVGMVASTEMAVVKPAPFIEQIHYDWLTKLLNNSTANWKILTTSNLFGSINNASLDSGTGNDIDRWDNHPAEKTQLLEFIKAFSLKNVVVTNGGFKAALANEVAVNKADYNPTAGKYAQLVEITLPSVTTPSQIDQNSSAGIQTEVRCLNKTYNPQIKMANFKDHGFVEMNISLKRIDVKWNFIKDIIVDNQSKLKSTVQLSIPNGKSTFE
ncbi:alkaline phosphatase D family protein [Solitalea sp. MAHUQ-68]|uniref:Alkaline phosphatase D family protein n=1 Tax=Solitalea agri TaxID=2953739 RepID=A0A9X2F492_9SPHI|nr:alkaline phosphatase D family protein [Solitalea agri]MCO4291498.1 alkaline phosphatase D family protein [Solitalea agri]